LTIDYVPEKLPFRDEERTALAQVLSTVFKGGRPSNLLLYGMPGTGKTAAVRSVTDTLERKAKEFKKDVKVLVVNAKDNNTPYKVLFEIAKSIGINESGGKVPFTGLSMGEATSRILHFIQEKMLRTILVIDEIDTLVDRNGDEILYTFTRANQRMTKGGFITLIGISNRTDFKEKLDPRVQSSLSAEEMVFNPYTVEQLRQILQERSKIAFNDGAISDGVINLCAAMAGREHGDARKAITLLRVAAELAERENTAKIEEGHVRSAEEKIEKDTNYVIVKNAPLHSKIVILAIAKSKNGNTGEVYNLYSALCKQADHEPLTQRRVTQIVSELDLQGIVSTDIVNQGRYGRSQRITLSIPMDTLREALKDDFSTLID
jgi:cell division control protein 6